METSGGGPTTAGSAAEDNPPEAEEATTSNPQDAKACAMRDMPPPAGYRRSAVPSRANRSAVYEHGVRFEQDCDNPDDSKMKWSCACGPACREQAMKGEGSLPHTKDNTGNITRHLKDKHGIVSSKTKARHSNAAKHQAAVSKEQEAVLKSHDPARAMLLLFVKVFIVSHLLAHRLGEASDVRMFFQVCGHALFPRTKLYHTMIKHCITELYRATVARFSDQLKSAVTGGGGPVLHANFDLWTSKTSREKYIGLRIFWATPKFALESALIAVKLFRPSAELSQSTQLSEVLLLWVQEVLAEFGLSTTDLFSTVTDSGSDVKRLCLKVLDSSWEWCFPHMLNCALVEGFGTTVQKKHSKNLAARKVIDEVKKVVEHLNRSNLMKVKFEDVQQTMFDNTTKLVNAVPQRWISACNVLEQVLLKWEALEKHYIDNERSGVFPLGAHKIAIEELYSLMKAVAVVIKDSQRTGAPTGLGTHMDVCMLRADTLDPTKPLTIQVPRKKHGGGSTTAVVNRVPESLQEVTTETRKLLAAAIDTRFFAKRYNEYVATSTTPDYLFEMAACMSPSLFSLRWIASLCSSAAEAARVQALVKGKVIDLMVTMAEAVGTQAVQSEKEPESSNKRKRSSASPTSSTRRDDAVAKRFAASSLFDGESDDDEEDGGAATLSVRDVCQQELDRFGARFKNRKRNAYPLDTLLSFWAQEGQSAYPNMARAARVLLSVPASSAVLERDFSTAGRVLSPSRSRMGAEVVEMTLFLNGNQKDIPTEVPSLSEEQAKDALPRRLTHPTPAVVALSTGEDELEVEADEDEEGEGENTGEVS